MTFGPGAACEIANMSANCRSVIQPDFHRLTMHFRHHRIGAAERQQRHDRELHRERDQDVVVPSSPHPPGERDAERGTSTTSTQQQRPAHHADRERGGQQHERRRRRTAAKHRRRHLRARSRSSGPRPPARRRRACGAAPRRRRSAHRACRRRASRRTAPAEIPPTPPAPRSRRACASRTPTVRLTMLGPGRNWQSA